MPENKTKPTPESVDNFLLSTNESRRTEANLLVQIMAEISGLKPIMWGPSIIGFGSKHYSYDSGREGDMPRIGFSPRKASITIYFAEGFDRYGDQLAKLGKYKTSVSCLYINKLADIDIVILKDMVKQSYNANSEPQSKPTTVDEFVAQVPTAARPMFDELRVIVKDVIPSANEVISYGILGYKVDEKRARVFISGWKDHVSMYPIPKDESLRSLLAPYIKGKGTLWFPLNIPLPKQLIKVTVKALL